MALSRSTFANKVYIQDREFSLSEVCDYVSRDISLPLVQMKFESLRRNSIERFMNLANKYEIEKDARLKKSSCTAGHDLAELVWDYSNNLIVLTRDSMTEIGCYL